MGLVETTTNIGSGDRIRRSDDRGGRVFSANARVTRAEQGELEAGAKREGKALSEWAREVLLDKARGGPTVAAASMLAAVWSHAEERHSLHRSRR